ncbi:MAG: ribosomal protein S18-alanine N-acetyltransferase [Candidatus Acidiferrales bacterium]
MIIRRLARSDIDAVLAIQSSCLEIAQWTSQDYARADGSEMSAWVAEEASEVAGFLVARPVASDLEILNFAVLPAARSRGIGTSLLSEVFNWGKSFNAGNVFIEVRASNSIALRFYDRHNFQIAGRRPSYYASPVEDAVLLAARLG